MEKVCSICGKKSAMSVTLVKLRGKYNPTSRVRKYPNLQWVRLPISKIAALQKTPSVKGKRVLACAKCIKRLAKI